MESEPAATAAGLHAIYGNDLTATGEVADIELAMTEHAKAVILECIQPSTVSSALTKAKKAGVIVVELCNSGAQLPTALEKSQGIYANDTYCYSCAGALMGDYAVLHTNGHVDAFIQEFENTISSDLSISGFRSVLKEYCPSACTTSATDIPFTASTETQVIESSASAAVLNPSINTFVPVFDFVAGEDVPVIASAHATSRISMLTQNADLAEIRGTCIGDNFDTDGGWRPDVVDRLGCGRPGASACWACRRLRMRTCPFGCLIHPTFGRST